MEFRSFFNYSNFLEKTNEHINLVRLRDFDLNDSP